jgi:hypothetical protein
MNRSEHLAWAKQRALEYLDIDNLPLAVSSMVSDLRKHDELGCPVEYSVLGMNAAMTGDTDEVRHWIEGFN